MCSKICFKISSKMCSKICSKMWSKMCSAIAFPANISKHYFLKVYQNAIPNQADLTNMAPLIRPLMNLANQFRDQAYCGFVGVRYQQLTGTVCNVIAYVGWMWLTSSCYNGMFTLKYLCVTVNNLQTKHYNVGLVVFPYWNVQYCRYHLLYDFGQTYSKCCGHDGSRRWWQGMLDKTFQKKGVPQMCSCKCCGPGHGVSWRWRQY